jgi:hypothetical protein
MLNGFDCQEDFMEHLPKGLPYVGNSFMQFIWNRVDQKLYTVNRVVLGRPINDEELEALGDKIVGQWSDGIGKGFKQEPVMKDEDGNDVYISPFHSEQEVHVTLIPIEIPKDHYWLGTIFDTPEKQMMYEDFMVDPIINNRFNKMLDSNNIEVPEGVNRENSPELPIHKKDKTTGELLISHTILKTFLQYQFAQNYIRGFEENTPEFDAGKVMMLYPRFCEFMMSCAEDQANGKEIHDFEGNYQNELSRAIKYIQKNNALMNTYANWSDIYSEPETKEKEETV